MSSEKKKEDKEFHVLTNDPSMTAWGWAVLNPCTNVPRVVESGCIKTTSTAKKLRIRAGDDRVRRIQEINAVLLHTIREFSVKLIVSELPHGSQSASAAVMIGMTTGLLQGIADSLVLPVEWYSQGDAKRKAGVGKHATKRDMVIKMTAIYGHQNWRTGVGYVEEAVADALGVFTVARDQSQVFRMMTNAGYYDA